MKFVDNQLEFDCMKPVGLFVKDNNCVEKLVIWSCLCLSRFSIIIFIHDVDKKLHFVSKLNFFLTYQVISYLLIFIFS